MNKLRGVLIVGIILVVLFGGIGFWYTQNHTAPLTSQVIGENEGKVFHFLSNACLDEITNLSAEMPLSETCREELQKIEPLGTTLDALCVQEISDIALGKVPGLTDVCRVKLYEFYNSPENTKAILEHTITKTQLELTKLAGEIDILVVDISTLETELSQLSQSVLAADINSNKKYTTYIATQKLYNTSAKEYARLKKISDKNKNITPGPNIQKQINDLQILLNKNKRKTAAEKIAYTKTQTQITELKNLLATNNEKLNMDTLLIRMNEEKVKNEEALIILNKAKSDQENATQLLGNKKDTLDLKKEDKQILENTLSYLESQKPKPIDDQETFGNWDENDNYGPDFDGVVIDVTPDVLNKYNFIYDNAEDKTLFETRVSEMQNLISSKKLGSIRLILWPDNSVDDKVEYSIQYKQNDNIYRVTELATYASDTATTGTSLEMTLAGVSRKKFKKYEALLSQVGGTCALQSILKSIKNACQPSGITLGNSWNPDYADKITQDALTKTKVKRDKKDEGTPGLNDHEIIAAMEANGFEKCDKITVIDFCSNPGAHKGKSCMLKAFKNNANPHVMYIKSAKNRGGFSQCEINVDDTGNQYNLPVNPGNQKWGIDKIIKPKNDPVFDALWEPKYVICCESACS